MSEKYYIINAERIIVGTGEVLEDGSAVSIENGSIQAVGTDIAISEDGSIIDAKGMTVMPGLIDAHVHLQGALPPKPFGRRQAPELTLIKAADDAKRLVGYGFTAIRDCGGMNGLHLRDAAGLGLIEGMPRIVACGNVLAPTNYGLDDPQLPEACFDAGTNRGTEFLVSDGVDACLRNSRAAIRNGADFIKIFNSGNYAFPHCSNHVTMFTEDELRAITGTAQAAEGRIVAAHCQSDESCRQAILCGVKSIEHAIGISEETADLGVERGAVYTSALTFAKHEPALNAAVWQEMITGYENIRKAGGILAIGSDMNTSPMFPFGENAQELVYLVEYCGYTAQEAITVGTRNGAIALGLENEIGTVEAGKSADLLIVDGDPLKDIGILANQEAIQKVFLRGTLAVDRQQN